MTEMLSVRAAAAADTSWAQKARHPLVTRRWQDVREAEEEIQARELRLTQADLTLAQARATLMESEQKDAARLAAWQIEGSLGPRPDPAAAAARQAVDDHVRAFQDLAEAVEAAERDRAALIESRRRMIVADAEKLLAERADKARELLSQLREARAELVDAASYRLWAMVFPSDAATAMPNWQALGCALAATSRTIGVPTQQLQLDRILAALEQDIQIVENIISPAQRAALVARGEMPSRLDKEAEWINPEHARADREARLEELARQAALELGVDRDTLTQEQFDNYVAELQAQENTWSA